MSGRRWLAAGCAGLVAVGLAGGLTGSAADEALRPAGTELPVTTASLACPVADASAEAPSVLAVAAIGDRLRPPSATHPDIALTPMSGPDARSRPLDVDIQLRRTSTKPSDAVVVTATGPGAGTVAALQRRLNPSGLRRGLLSVNCEPPGTDWWLTGAEGGIGYNDDLVLTNPGSTVANVTITAWSERGPLDPPKLRAFTVDPNTLTRLKVADYFPDEPHITMHVTATSGRITAAVADSRFTGVTPGGIDWIAPTQPPARDVVVPGYVGGDGFRRLIITNPGDIDATVKLRLARQDGNFTPAEHPSVVVRAGHSISLDITEAMADISGAVVLASDQPIVAAGLTKLVQSGVRMKPDIQWQPAGAAITGPAVLADNAPPFNRAVRVFFVAPDANVSVRVTSGDGQSEVIRVVRGRTYQMDPANVFGPAVVGPYVITPIGDVPVYVARTLLAYGAHGPLVTSTQPMPLPRPVELPPVVADQRAATG
jgi:hypothetical protein